MFRSGFSFHVAAGHLRDVVSRAKEIGLKAVPLSDRASTFGFVELEKACKKEDLKPVYGVELGVVPTLGEKKPRPDYFKFLAIDALRPLHDLIREATMNVGREPSISYAQVIEAPGVYKISGERLLVDLLPENLEGSNFYAGLSPAMPKATFNKAKKRGLQFVAISDNYYPREDDKEFYRITLGARRANTQTYPMFILSDEEWRKSVSWFADEDIMNQAIVNRDMILEKCNAKIKKATLLVTDKPKTLREMCEDGARRIGVDLSDPVYAARLTRELDMIEQKQFSDYFYIIADAIAYAKTKMIVGPARGSSCGSLVCYLLDITTVDPLPYDLLFERFIDVNRADLPDVDIDFSDARRHLVFEYMADKYGSERVGRLGSVNTMGVRSSLNQVGIALRIPSWEIEKVADGAIKRLAGDARASSTIEDTLQATDAGKKMLEDYPEVMVVTKMEDHPASASQHAAGVVLTEEPLAEYVAVNATTGAVLCDKKDAEELNLLKIDALGLKQLSVFERTLELIGASSLSKDRYLEKLPLDDEGAFRVLNERRFSGIFQFMGSAVRGITEQITITSLEDIIAIGALARPGPLASGGTDMWIRRKNGTEKVSYAHPSLQKFTESSFGTLLYQEQVMQIGREVGGLSWEEVSSLRRAMSKSLGKEFFDKFGDKWKAGAIAGGWDPAVAEKFWNELVQWGAMGFNRAHSVAYGFISYWCAYLKAHHPLEFAAATLDMEAEPAKQIEMLRELAREGIQYVPVDRERSTDKWEPYTKGNERILIGPLTNVEGLGPKTVVEILDSRRTGKELKGSVAKRLASAKTKIDSLYPISDAINRLHPDLLESGIRSKPTPIAEIQPGFRGEVVIFALANRFAPSDENAPVKVTKRGGKVYSGPSTALNMFVADDTDTIFCKVDRRDFERLGKKVLNEGGPGKALWAIKGTVPSTFRMISVRDVKYLGRIDDERVEDIDGILDDEDSKEGEAA